MPVLDDKTLRLLVQLTRLTADTDYVWALVTVPYSDGHKHVFGGTELTCAHIFLAVRKMLKACSRWILPSVIAIIFRFWLLSDSS